MQVTRVMNFSSHVNQNHAKTQNFNGHWESSTRGATYPYEDCDVRVETYVADADESFEQISKNFFSRADRAQGDIFRRNDIYTIGGTNYFIDLSQNREAKKRSLTMSSEHKIKNKKWVEAVEDKLKIARILKEQGPRMERDKFLTEEGIRNIFYRAGGAEKDTIANMVKGYSTEMAKPLFAFLRRSM